MRRSALALLLGCLLLVAGASALDGYDYYQTIEYAGCDQSVYQQDIVIHRSAGTAYNETAGGLETWHLYVGTNCQEDYGDLRFTNSTEEIAYYLWPDYDSNSARFSVRLEDAADAGMLLTYYGNATAETTGGTYGAVFNEAIANPSFETSESWTYSESDKWGGCAGTLPSSGWSSDGAKSAYINCAFSGMYYGATYFGQYSQSITVPPGQYILVFDCYGSEIYRGFMSIYAGSTRVYHSESAGAKYAQQSEPLISTGDPVTLSLRNGVYSFPSDRRGRGYWDNLMIRSYSATPPAALTFSGEQETAAPPTAAFTANTPAGLAPLTVQFTDTSAGSPTSWAWTFGDSGTSTTQNPQHTYTTPGAYSVNLTATNEYGSDYELKTDYITVYGPVSAQFTTNVTGGTAPLTVQFTDLSTGGPTAWSWSFGDGGTSTAQNPQHTYTAASTYSVTLTASHPYDSDTETKTAYITIAVLQPFPGITALPRDLTGTGLYEDINGNSRLDYNDLTLFFLNLAWAKANQPTECFDFNQNGRLDYADVIALFQVIKNA